MNTDKKEFITSSEEETENIGKSLAMSLSKGDAVLLRGNLGAGKTVFSRGFARGLGITEPVSSPTYTIVQEYELPDGGRLYHLDLYRISGVNAALAFGVDEFLDDPQGISLIEWPDRIDGILPENAICVEIEHLSDSERRLTICR
ncbi:MAG: tRNA (adenosine(37)-N6)-threonylcarbamoyltransferase complex ATPase subunit type 1 TsaE [Lentisphaerae bacterium]|nr:tRNA (adenosine(37)-N6)-threonylcarbamoyltransferase complex ATPase subunit type 1 TsaE [Lentisphaerota bacterium]